MYTASDYWLVDGKLHYMTSYSTESVVDMDEVDLQRTVDENAKRGVTFTLKPYLGMVRGLRRTRAPCASAERHWHGFERSGGGS